jgi:hypothetical protein
MRSNASQGRTQLESKIAKQVALQKQARSFENDFLDDLKLPSVDKNGSISLNVQPVTTMNSKLSRLDAQR